jgi:hypothetical protein
MAAWTGNVFHIERMCDSARRLADSEGLEDAAYDCGFGIIDLLPAAVRLAARIEFADDIVAVAQPAARSSLPNAPFEAATDLLPEVP